MTEQMPALTRLERRQVDLHLTYDDGSNSCFPTSVTHALCKVCAFRNADETSKSLRRQMEALPPASQPCARSGITP